MRINLSNHLAIGFHKEWLRMQGLEGKNLLELLVRNCANTKVRVVGITSEESKPIVKGSIDDRFSYLLKDCSQDFKNKGYKSELADENMLLVQTPENRIVRVVNSQTVQALEQGNLVKVLVFGGNYINNSRPLKETIIEAREKGYLVIAENPCGKGNNSPIVEAIMTNKEEFDGIVTHDAQYILPSLLFKYSFLKEYTKGVNKLAGKLAESAKLSGVAIGNQHSPNNCKGSIEIQDARLDTSSTKKLVNSIRAALFVGRYAAIKKYESPIIWYKWTKTFRDGIKDNRHMSFS